MSGTASPGVPPSPAALRVANLERAVQRQQEAQATFATTTNRELQELRTRSVQLESTLREREDQLRQLLDQAAAQRSSELAQLIAEAKSEFDTQRAALQSVVTGG